MAGVRWWAVVAMASLLAGQGGEAVPAMTSRDCPEGTMLHAGVCAQEAFEEPTVGCPLGFSDGGTSEVLCTASEPATPFCSEGFQWKCKRLVEKLQSGDSPCACESKILTRRTRECPAGSKKVVIEDKEMEGEGGVERDEVFKCEVVVEDEQLGVCNHGMVVDYHSNRCMAYRAIDANCHCPIGYRRRVATPHGKCEKEGDAIEGVSPPRVLLPRAAPSREGEGEMEGGAQSNVIFGAVKKEAENLVDLQCFCPKEMITAEEFYLRTADSTVALADGSGVINGSSVLTHPGKGGCYAVEFHEILRKCDNSHTTTTVDNKGDSTPTNDCVNRVLVDPVFVCEDGLTDTCKTQWEGPFASSARPVREMGFGRLVNPKRCQCEGSKIEDLQWKCQEGWTKKMAPRTDGVASPNEYGEAYLCYKWSAPVGVCEKGELVNSGKSCRYYVRVAEATRQSESRSTPEMKRREAVAAAKPSFA